MQAAANVVSKILVLESDPACLRRIKQFCDESNLVGLTGEAENVMSVLRLNVDLGGIFISENYGGTQQGGLLMARKIHALRTELPIFMRRDERADLDDIPDASRKSLSAAFTIDQIDTLVPLLDQYIFRMAYPNVLLRGIIEMTHAALQSQFKGVDVDVASPYIVRDRLIYGEIFTLIAVESNWCRGYMMLQTEQETLLTFVKANKTHIDPEDGSNFRNLNELLGEVTNLVWGSFKNRYTSYYQKDVHASQVPIIINHLHRYISFGSQNPLICFRYTLSDPSNPDMQPLVLYQKFVFNLNWSPEHFQENPVSVEDLVAFGELDLF